MKFVLATANPGKIKEMRDILSQFSIDVLTRDDLEIDIDIEETGTTFLENATLKAEVICAKSGLPAIADDSGLVVEALGGDPGVFSSTFGGEELNDAQRCLYLLKLLENMEQRRAKFVCTIVCSFPDGSKLTAMGECTGTIATEPHGMGGFGYDPIFIAEGMKKTMAELSSNEKNAISHRRKALDKFTELLVQLNSYKECSFI